MKRSYFLLFIIIAFLNGCEIGIISPYVRMEKINDIKKYEISRFTKDGMLYHYLHSKDSQVRNAAILALGRIGNPEAIPYLIKELYDADEDNVKAAIFSLGLIGEKSSEKELMNLLDLNPDLAPDIIEALGMIKSKEAIDKILKLMKPNKFNIIKEAAYALANIGNTKAAAELKKYINLKDEEVREAIYYSLYKIGDEESINLFLNGLEDKNTWVRYYSVKGIGRLKKIEAIPFLYKRLNDAEWNVVLAGLEALGNYSKIDIGKIRFLKNSKNHHIRCKLAEILANFKEEEGISLIKQLLKDKSDMVKKSAVISLSKTNASEALKYAEKNYNKSNWIVRVGIAEALANINNDKSLKILKKMINDKDIRVKEAALEALGKFKNKDAEEIFSKCVNEEDFAIRAICAENLSKYNNKVYVEKLVTALMKSVYEKEYESQQIIIKSLVSLDKEFALEIVKEMLNSENLGIRLLSARLLKENYNLDYSKLVYEYEGKLELIEYEGYKGSPLIYIETNKGNFVLRLYGDQAPMHTANMINLAKSGFYNNLIFHRVEPGFVVQGGDIRGDGWGTAGINIPDEINKIRFKRGTLGMPLAGKDTGGCQFFITLTPRPALNYKFTAFGEVIEGMSVVDNLEIGDRILKTIVIE